MVHSIDSILCSRVTRQRRTKSQLVLCFLLGADLGHDIGPRDALQFGPSIGLHVQSGHRAISGKCRHHPAYLLRGIANGSIPDVLNQRRDACRVVTLGLQQFQHFLDQTIAALGHVGVEGRREALVQPVRHAGLKTLPGRRRVAALRLPAGSSLAINTIPPRGHGYGKHGQRISQTKEHAEPAAESERDRNQTIEGINTVDDLSVVAADRHREHDKRDAKGDHQSRTKPRQPVARARTRCSLRAFTFHFHAHSPLSWLILLRHFPGTGCGTIPFPCSTSHSVTNRWSASSTKSPPCVRAETAIAASTALGHSRYRASARACW